MPGHRVGVDGEHHRRGVVLPVVGGEVVHAGEVVGSELEVMPGGVRQLVVIGAVAARVDLDVSVEVDGVDRGDVDGG